MFTNVLITQRLAGYCLSSSLHEKRDVECVPSLDFGLVVPLDHLRSEVLKTHGRSEGLPDAVQVGGKSAGRLH